MTSIPRLSRPVHRRRQHRGPRAIGQAHDDSRPGHTALVTLPAELDLLSAPQAGDRLRAALTSSGNIVIADLTATSYCDVAAARMLLRAGREVTASGGQLRLAVPAGPVRHVLELLAVDGQLNLYPSVRDATGDAVARWSGHLSQLGEGAVP